jgi:hypothetical protein
MRRSRVVGVTVGAVLFAGACATSSGTASSSRYSATPSPQATSRTLGPVERDSVLAQAVADREGPRVSISAEFTNAASTRRVRANFHLDDDAYVVVGHLDADGILRITFPSAPGDDGFVRGQHTYHTSEFFAGFADQYRYRAQSAGLFRTTQASYDSYDGGLGYVFIIASWRPMHFEQFSTNGNWDTFEVADPDYMRDPRPAIYELASVLAGENREAYTVKFARFFDTERMYSGSSSYSSAFGNGFCSGYEPLGFGSTPFENRYNFNPLYAYGTTFDYRGSRYYYDSAGDCYRSSPGFFYGNQYGIAYGSPVNTPPTRPRTFNLDGPRKPGTPRVPPGHVMPLNSGQTGGDVTNADQTTPVASPHYRQRGLITTDEPGTGPIRRQPRVETRPTDDGARPSIQEMTNRRGLNSHEGTGWSRSQIGSDRENTNQGTSSGVERRRERTEPSNGETRGYSRPTATDNPRSAPARSEPRSAPTPRAEAPARTSPPPERSAPRAEPAARSSEPRSQPASSGSTGSKPPEKTPNV